MDQSTNSRLATIRRKLEQMVSRGARPFGVEAHEMELRSPLSEAEVEGYEQAHGVLLPADYRAFLLEVAAGGAGPAYGLVPLAKALTLLRPSMTEAHLRRPFPHVETYERADNASEPDDIAGTLVVCHEGCGYLHLLVVTGTARGQVWLDGLSSDCGLQPIASSFLDWYEAWLDHSLCGGNGLWWFDLE